MPSPFPGMDPYLEGHLWPDVHNSLSYLIKVQLAPRLPNAYRVHLQSYTVEDTSPEKEIGIMYPYVGVYKPGDQAREPAAAYGAGITPPTAILPVIKPVEVSIPVVEIRGLKDNRLITSIEVLSPVNKRVPGFVPYCEKRDRFQDADVHLIEIDLLRRGYRALRHPRLPPSHYLVSLVKAGTKEVQVWALDIKDTLPVIPVPLQAPDADCYLDLGKAMDDLYEQGCFEKSIDYGVKPPPPDFSEVEMKWMGALLICD